MKTTRLVIAAVAGLLALAACNKSPQAEAVENAGDNAAAAAGTGCSRTNAAPSTRSTEALVRWSGTATTVPTWADTVRAAPAPAVLLRTSAAPSRLPTPWRPPSAWCPARLRP